MKRREENCVRRERRRREGGRPEVVPNSRPFSCLNSRLRVSQTTRLSVTGVSSLSCRDTRISNILANHADTSSRSPAFPFECERTPVSNHPNKIPKTGYNDIGRSPAACFEPFSLDQCTMHNVHNERSLYSEQIYV